MKLYHFIAVIIALVACHDLHADYVDFKNGSKRQFGLTVSESPKLIEMLIFNDSESAKPIRKSYDRKIIQKHVRTIDQERLASLNEKNLVEYRDYGEELASVAEDPVARTMAIRLFAICLAGGDAKLQKSAGLNLPALASTLEEKWKFNGLAFIYGGKQIEFERNEARLDESMKRELLRLVQSVRRQQYKNANILISKPATKKAVEATGRITVQEVESAIDSRQVQPGLRIKLLRLESELIAGTFNQTDNLNKMSRSESFEFVPENPKPLPTIQNAFEFDLHAIRFQAGRWVKP